MKRTLFLLVVAGMLAACQPPPPSFNAADITGIQGYGNDFRLTDHIGTPRTMADFRGKVVFLFFGFAQCPDVCPRTLSDMKKVVTQLGADAAKFQVLFVTVDPARDTQEVMAQYVTAFHPTFIGLRGDHEATAGVTRDFKIVAHRQEGQTPETYTINHTASALVFDTAGRLRLLVPYEMDPTKLAADVLQLIKGK